MFLRTTSAFGHYFEEMLWHGREGEEREREGGKER